MEQYGLSLIEFVLVSNIMGILSTFTDLQVHGSGLVVYSPSQGEFNKKGKSFT